MSEPERTYLVESPLQVLCANEARHHFGPGTEDRLVVLMPGEERARSQIERTIAFTAWGDVRRLPARRATNHLTRWRRLTQLAGEGVADLWVGDYSSPLMRAAAGDGPLQLLDDGMATLTVNQRRRQRAAGEAEVEVIARPRHVLATKQVLARLVGLARPEPEVVRYFTMYPLSAPAGDEVISNDFGWLRHVMTGRRVCDDALFLGSSFADLGGTDSSAWASLTRAACADLGTTVHYLPHRRESARVSARVASEGIALSALEGPVEVDLAEAEELPRVVAAFFSTALHTLARVLPPEVELRAFRIPAELVSPLWRDRLERIYDDLPTLTGGRVVVTDL